MKNVKQILCIAFAAMFCLCVFTGCGAKRTAATDWEYIQENKTLVIGITNYKPINYYEGDKLVGFDTEYAQAVCDKLGITPKFIEIDWDTKETELDAFNIDCIWNGMTYTAARDENMDFSDKYMYNFIVAVIRTEDAAKYADKATLASGKLVAEGGSTAEGIIKEDENLKKAKYIPSDTLVSSLMEVSARTADVAIVDSIIAKNLIGTGAYKDLMIIDGLVFSEETLAVGFRTGSNLVEKINGVTDELLADGTLQAIAAKYKLNDLITE